MREFLSRQRQLLREDWRGSLRASSLCAFGAFVLIGAAVYALCLWKSDLSARFFSFLLENSALGDLAELEGFSLFLSLFRNNLVAMLSAITMGLLPFVFFPAFSLGVNAAILGMMAALYQENGYGLFAFFVGILPHGIFELPALFLSCGAGLTLCRAITDEVRGRRESPFSAAVFRALRTLWLVVPLLLLAAAVEAFLTPILLDLALAA